MPFNWSDLIDAVEKVAEVIDSPAVGELASLGGPEAAAITKTVQTAAGFVSSVAEQAQTAGDVLSSNDLAKIAAAQTAIWAQNDTLAAQIAAS